REQRLVYILGEIFEVSDVVGAELLEISRENFRQRLARARRELHSFMNDRCGLVNPTNPCRCAKKTRAFMQAGYVDPRNLLFARECCSLLPRRMRRYAAAAYFERTALGRSHIDAYFRNLSPPIVGSATVSSSLERPRRFLSTRRHQRAPPSQEFRRLCDKTLGTSSPSIDAHARPRGSVKRIAVVLGL